ncbi:hypothetical protein LCGC14_3033250, partial [marine sediment metagenome]
KYAVVARVQVHTNSNYFPVKIGDVLTYPLGTFWTTLTTPELILARAKGWIKSISHMAKYHPAPLFQNYSNYFQELRENYQKSGQDDWADIAKLFRNGLYGKFGQEGYWQEQVGTAKVDEVWRMPGYDADKKERYNYTAFGGKVFYETRSGESYNSFPAISAHVTAYARLYLKGLVDRVPRGHVYYMDTDALIVDDIGLKALTGFFDDRTAGMLRVEVSSPWLVIIAPRDYTMQDRVRLKGVKPDTDQIASVTAVVIGRDIWDLGIAGATMWLPPQAARTHQIASSSAEDGAGGATGALTIRIFGLDAAYLLQQEDLVLNGAGNVPTASPYTMIHRMFVLTAGSAGRNLGNIDATADTDG